MSRTSVIPLAIALGLASSAAGAEPGASVPSELAPLHESLGADPHAGARVYDLIVLRPLGFVQLALGAVLLVPTWPVAWLVDGDEDVVRACVRDPAARTLGRPLGRR